jgi:hypothetical protein
MKKKENSKRSTTLEVKTSCFYWNQQSGDASPNGRWREFLAGEAQIGPVVLGNLH